MRTPVATRFLEHALVVVGPDGGMPTITWADPAKARAATAAPPYACTVWGYDDMDQRDATLSNLLAIRDNSTVHASFSPAAGGPHVILTVHLDRPVDHGSPYETAVTYVYASRGGSLDQGGQGDWVKAPHDAWYSGEPCRTRTSELGVEVAWSVGNLNRWLDPDLARRLQELLAKHGLRLLGGPDVVGNFGDDPLSAVGRSETVQREFQTELDRLVFIADARTELRQLLGSPAVRTMLNRLAAGCVVLWSDSFGGSQRMPSHQIRPGGGTPFKVDGAQVRALVRLGIAESFWKPAPGAGFFGAHWDLVRLSDRGHRLLSGDLSGAVEGARRECDMPKSFARPRPMRLVETVLAYAAGLPEAAKDDLRAELPFKASIDIAALVKRIGPLEPLAMVLNALICGTARLGSDGRLVAIRRS